MKILLKELIDARQSFDKILGVEIDVKLAYRIRRISNKIISEMKLYNEQKGELLQKYSEKNKDGELVISSQVGNNIQYKLKSAKIKEFDDKVKELLDIEIDLGVELIPWECLEGLKISGYDMGILEEFIEKPNDKPQGKGIKAGTPSQKATRK